MKIAKILIKIVAVFAVFLVGSQYYYNSTNMMMVSADSLEDAFAELAVLDQSERDWNVSSDFTVHFTEDTSFIIETPLGGYYIGQGQYTTRTQTGQVVYCIEPDKTATVITSEDYWDNRFSVFTEEEQQLTAEIIHIANSFYAETNDPNYLVAGQLLVWDVSGSSIVYASDNLYPLMVDIENSLGQEIFDRSKQVTEADVSEFETSEEVAEFVEDEENASDLTYEGTGSIIAYESEEVDPLELDMYTTSGQDFVGESLYEYGEYIDGEWIWYDDYLNGEGNISSGEGEEDGSGGDQGEEPAGDPVDLIILKDDDVFYQQDTIRNPTYYDALIDAGITIEVEEEIGYSVDYSMITIYDKPTGGNVIPQNQPIDTSVTSEQTVYLEAEDEEGNYSYVRTPLTIEVVTPQPPEMYLTEGGSNIFNPIEIEITQGQYTYADFLEDSGIEIHSDLYELDTSSVVVYDRNMNEVSHNTSFPADIKTSGELYVQVVDPDGYSSGDPVQIYYVTVDTTPPEISEETYEVQWLGFDQGITYGMALYESGVEITDNYDQTLNTTDIRVYYTDDPSQDINPTTGDVSQSDYIDTVTIGNTTYYLEVTDLDGNVSERTPFHISVANYETPQIIIENDAVFEVTNNSVATYRDALVLANVSVEGIIENPGTAFNSIQIFLDLEIDEDGNEQGVDEVQQDQQFSISDVYTFDVYLYYVDMFGNESDYEKLTIVIEDTVLPTLTSGEATYNVTDSYPYTFHDALNDAVPEIVVDDNYYDMTYDDIRIYRNTNCSGEAIPHSQEIEKIVGTQTFYIQAVDGSENRSSCETLTIVHEYNEGPQISVGSTPVYEAGTEVTFFELYEAADVIVEDDYYGILDHDTITAFDEIDSTDRGYRGNDEIDTTTTGTHSYYLESVNDSGNVTDPRVEITYEVVDTTPPEIIIEGNYKIQRSNDPDNVETNITYYDAIDDGIEINNVAPDEEVEVIAFYDSELTNEIMPEDEIDLQVTEDYEETIYILAIDEVGNISDLEPFTIEVGDATPPEIEIVDCDDCSNSSDLEYELNEVVTYEEVIDLVVLDITDNRDTLSNADISVYSGSQPNEEDLICDGSNNASFFKSDSCSSVLLDTSKYGRIEFYVHAWDESGNHTSERVRIEITDNTPPELIVPSENLTYTYDVNAGSPRWSEYIVDIEAEVIDQANQVDESDIVIKDKDTGSDYNQSQRIDDSQVNQYNLELTVYNAVGTPSNTIDTVLLIEDISAPVITMGKNTVFYDYLDNDYPTYSEILDELTVTAVDNVDGELSQSDLEIYDESDWNSDTGEVIDGSTPIPHSTILDTSIQKNYTYCLSAIDSSGNRTLCDENTIFEVQVEDTVSPVLEVVSSPILEADRHNVNSSNPYTYGDWLDDTEFEYKYAEGADTSNITIWTEATGGEEISHDEALDLSMDNLNYHVYLELTDLSGNVSKQRTSLQLYIGDTTPPTITSDDVNIQQGSNITYGQILDMSNVQIDDNGYELDSSDIEMYDENGLIINKNNLFDTSTIGYTEVVYLSASDPYNQMDPDDRGVLTITVAADGLAPAITDGNITYEYEEENKTYNDALVDARISIIDNVDIMTIDDIVIYDEQIPENNKVDNSNEISQSESIDTSYLKCGEDAEVVYLEATDSSGNTTKPRSELTIEVCDTMAPELYSDDDTITLELNEIPTVTYGEVLEYLNVYAIDNYDGMIEVSELHIRDQNYYNSSVILHEEYIDTSYTSYQRFYVFAEDSNGNVSEALEINVYVIDTIPPIIGGDEKVYVEHNSYVTYANLIETANVYIIDGEKIDVNEIVFYSSARSNSEVASNEAIDTSKIGTTSIWLEVEDSSGNVSERHEIVIEVLDTTAPTIEVNDILINQNEISEPTYYEAMVLAEITVEDNVDVMSIDDIVIYDSQFNEIRTDSKIDTTEAIDQVYYLEATDSSGNTSELVEWNIYIDDVTPPEITATDVWYQPTGELSFVSCGKMLDDANVEIYDNVDTDLDKNNVHIYLQEEGGNAIPRNCLIITTSENVETIYLEAVDSSGNVSERVEVTIYITEEHPSTYLENESTSGNSGTGSDSTGEPNITGSTSSGTEWSESTSSNGDSSNSSGTIDVSNVDYSEETTLVTNDGEVIESDDYTGDVDASNGSSDSSSSTDDVEVLASTSEDINEHLTIGEEVAPEAIGTIDSYSINSIATNITGESQLSLIIKTIIISLLVVVFTVIYRREKK